ncbi:MAG: SAM-dependent methyltransferase [Synechococcus sp. ARS1019]|nr:SAM-dependent methyltransferase [Synechococcus sp. ARS1019]|tara:strand:+ start:150 stop:1223 length:1074 start_codon:yes stop_codon:yes gene_type:complete
MASTPLSKFAYQTLQQGKSIAGLAHKELSTKLMELMAPDAVPKTEAIPAELLNELRSSMSALSECDWEDAERGIYPTELLFDAPWLDWASRYPQVWFDLPSTWSRRQQRNVRDLPDDTEPSLYPEYYLQNFHHQTDGYLSDHSAELYDLQVEILFNGTADAMRRRVIAPLKRALRHFSDRAPSSLRILDIATGTGRTLHQIRGALPHAELTGTDLSEAYLRQANRWLNAGKQRLVQLVRANAEQLPLASNSLQGATCVFLFHELPGEARQNVINEAWRVLEPGGVLVIADSVQLADSPQFSTAMENFRRVFHEPYYRDYIADDIDTRLKDAGFIGITAESHFMTRVWSARKPEPTDA